MRTTSPQLAFEIPADEEYRALRSAAGLSAMSAEAAALGPPSGWCSVCARGRRPARWSA